MRKQPGSHYCFICGRRNPIGMKMHFVDIGPGEVLAEHIVSNDYQGYPGVVHGGIVAAMLDETAGRSVLAGQDNERFFMTLKLETRYRHPVPTETPLTIKGELTSIRGKRATAHGEIRLPDGKVAAEADLLLVEMPATMLENVNPKDLGWQVDND